MSVSDLFKAADGEFLRFERIPEAERRHVRPDLCALLYLHERLGGERDAIAAAEHDIIYLCWERADLAKLAAEDVVYISRCGVHYDDGLDSLTLFV